MHRNSRHCIHRGGEVTSSSGLGNPTPTYTTSLAHLPIFVPPVFRLTCRPSGALGCLVHAACYKHVAPLGLNAAMHRNSRHCIHRGGEVSSSSGLGNPTPTYTTSLAHVPIFVPPVFRLTCRPSGAKCGIIGGAVSIVGERSPCPAGWGTQPLRTVCDNTTLRSSGARGLDVSRCYRHIAPLERKAAMHRNSRHCIHRGGEWGEVISLPSGLGNPTPTHTTSLAHVPIFVPPVFRCTCRPSGALGCLVHAACYKHVAPLGLWDIWCMPRAINMSPLWGFGIFGVCRVL